MLLPTAAVCGRSPLVRVETTRRHLCCRQFRFAETLSVLLCRFLSLFGFCSTVISLFNTHRKSFGLPGSVSVVLAVHLWSAAVDIFFVGSGHACAKTKSLNRRPVGTWNKDHILISSWVAWGIMHHWWGHKQQWLFGSYVGTMLGTLWLSWRLLKAMFGHLEAMLGLCWPA